MKANETKDNAVQENAEATAAVTEEKNLVNTDSINEATPKNEVAVKQQNALVERQGAYITQLLYKIKEEFVEINAGIDLDFVYMGDRLKVDKKGNFVEADDDTVKLGDVIDVIIGAGEKLYSLWGQKDSPEDGKLIVAEASEEKAQEMLTAYVAENPEAGERYTFDDIKLRFITYFVPVSSIASDFPQIYLMTFPMTTTIQFGKYGMKIFKGKYATNGVPARTAMNQVITRFTTVEKQGQGNDSYIGIDFEAIGMFNPEEYELTNEE